MKDPSGKLATHTLNILNYLDDGIYVSDGDGMTLHVNPAYERLTGLRSSDLLGKNVLDLHASGVLPKVINPEVVKKRAPVNHLLVLDDGRRVATRGFPVINQEGKVDLVMTVVRDVTLIGQMQERLSHQKDVISSYHNQIENLTSRFLSENFLHDAPHIQKITELVERVAVTDATILLLGESGVGKDRFARLAHEHSTRKKEVFLKVDCGSITESLIESELFGYAPGAFTGAAKRGKAGHFEIANKGTIFLDEIGELPLAMQAKLLRVLQDQEIVAVGASTPKKVNVRVIAATNRNLEEEVNKGNFRADLYYRLRVAVVDIPALRQVPEMIPGLVHHFLELFGMKYRKAFRCPEKTMELFCGYRWPGNIRELENMIHSLVITSVGSEIRPEDLPPSIHQPERAPQVIPPELNEVSTDKTLKEIMAELEQQVIRQVIEQQGTAAKAAQILGVNRTTLFRKLRN